MADAASASAARLQKPSAAAWLKAGVATTGAAAGAAIIGFSLHVLASRTDTLPSVADFWNEWERAVLRTSGPATASAISEVAVQGGSSTPPVVTEAALPDPEPAGMEAAALPGPEMELGHVAEHPGETAAAGVTQAAVKQVILRGDYMVTLGDYTAARLLYRFAMERGSAVAALKLARMYDEEFPARSLGPRPDPDEAARWYQAAGELLSSAHQADE